MQTKKQSKLQVGTTVHLNSSSPDLTVTSIDGSSVAVEWNSESGISAGVFPRSCIH
jgi:FKBP-type peptidyl-prolyl cis-trans isomerase 2